MQNPDPNNPAAQAQVQQPQAPPQPMVIDQAALTAILASITQAQQRPAHPTPPTPRCGGVNTVGAWTGGGSRSDATSPRTNLCLRALKMEPYKAFPQLTIIEKECRSGLKSTTSPLFCLSNEPDAKHIITVINNLEDFLTTHGMESVFQITDGVTKLDMLKRPALLKKTVIDQWVKTLTIHGVYSQGENSTRLPVCEYDRTNLEWSYDAVLNSCSDALVLDLKRNLKDDQATGPALLYAILQICYRQAESKVESVLKQIEKLNLRDFPGQNVTSYKQKLDEYLTELEMNLPNDEKVPGLRNKSLKGLTQCTFDFFRNRVLEKLITGESASVNDIKDIVKELDILYLTLIEQDNYPPGSKTISEDTKVLALQAEMKFLKTEMTKLHQDRTASSTKGTSTGGPGPSILRNSDKTVQFKSDQGGASVSSNKPSQRTPKPNGLSEAVNAQLTTLIKEKLQTMPKFDEIPADASYTIEIDGATVATFCNKCHRFTRGTSQHTTQEHKGPSMRAKGYMTALNSGSTDSASLSTATLAPIQAPTSSYAFYSAPAPAAASDDVPFDPVLLATLGSLSLYPKE
jgi:hypothetical protein